MPKVRFLGAAGTVTGSKFLISGKRGRILIDAGLFQGDRGLRDRNWQDLSFSLNSLDAILLTHAHIDHTGMLPRFGRMGMKCPIYATPPTAELSRLLLVDSGRINEEDALFRAHNVGSRHNPPQPLYTEDDAKKIVELFRAVNLYEETVVAPGITATWIPAGHMLGAASLKIIVDGHSILCSGDIGRYEDDLLPNAAPREFGEMLLIEGTYGGRIHEKSLESVHGSKKITPEDQLTTIINDTVRRRGIVLIPSFAIGRTQQLLYQLKMLKKNNLIPDIPIIIDSPMAHDATAIFGRHPSYLAPTLVSKLARGDSPFRPSKLGFTSSRYESKKLNGIDEPMILISASGMLSGGRILHHLKMRLTDPRNTVLFVGYQPPASRGAKLLTGESTIQIFHEDIPVRAQIAEITGFSAHADHNELLRWAKDGSGIPDKTFIVHAEPHAAKDLQTALTTQFSWSVSIAEHEQEVEF